MRAYIEIKGAVRSVRLKLFDNELQEIGGFTRESILRWLENVNYHRNYSLVGVLPVKDFHAVCGDIGIPWATEEGRLGLPSAPWLMRAYRGYIDIKGVAVDRHELTDSELQEIDEFTRENVSRWLKRWLDDDCDGVFWGALNYFEDDDFHAVCCDIEIPWAEEETRQKWDERFGDVWPNPKH